MKIWQYKNCSTCKKALEWLDAQGLEYEAVDIVGEPPSLAELTALYERSGLPLKKLFNTAGQSYRGGNFKQRLPAMTDAQALEALAEDGKLIKRPLVDAGDAVLVGFREADWAAALGYG